MRETRELGLAAALTGALMAAAAVPAGAQRPTFGPTLFWESGLINAPAASVPPLGGDVALSMSRLSLGDAAASSVSASGSSLTMTIAGSLWGRAELGLSVFTADLNAGLFGKVLLHDQTNAIWRRGLIHWLPSVAVGIRNVGGEVTLNRFALIGTERATRDPSVYGVATRTFILRPAPDGDQSQPRVQGSVTAGYGRGLFADGLGSAYAPSGTSGVFGGGSLDFAIGRNSSLSLMVEHDAWALNAGVRLEAQGVRLSVYRTDLDGSAGENGAPSFSQPKIALAVGWQAHVLTLLRGNRLEERTAAAERQQGDLEREARLAQQRIDALQVQIGALRAVTEQQRIAERADLERRLKEEQDALKRLQDLIKTRATKPPPDGGGE